MYEQDAARTAGLMIQVAILWLFFACWSAGLASRRGQGLLGFVLGLLLGPFGVLVSAYSAGRYKACPFCRELRHLDATICPHCQRADAA